MACLNSTVAYTYYLLQIGYIIHTFFIHFSLHLSTLHLLNPIKISCIRSRVTEHCREKGDGADGRAAGTTEFYP